MRSKLKFLSFCYNGPWLFCDLARVDFHIR